MQETIYICDQCGKKLIADNWLVSFKRHPKGLELEIDLCADCYNEQIEKALIRAKKTKEGYRNGK